MIAIIEAEKIEGLKELCPEEIQQKKERQLKKEQELKEYLDLFYGYIYNARMLIQMHFEIANAVRKKRLQYTQWWGCLQNNLLISLIVGNMFAIFDENNKYALKSFVKFLRALNIYSITEKDVKNWLTVLKPYEDYRNCKIAHASLEKPFVPPVDYAPFLVILDQFEKKLIGIHTKYITHHAIKNGTWNSSTVNPNAELLQHLRSILVLSSLPEYISNGDY